MNQKQNNGIRICQTVSSGKNKHQWILPLVTGLVSSIIFLLAGAELTGFENIYSPWVMVLGAAGFCLAYGILAKLEKESWFYPGSLVLLFAMVLCGKGAMLGAFATVWNQIGVVWTTAYGQVLPQLEGSGKESLMLFSIFVGGLTATLCSMVAFWHKRIFVVVLPAVLFAGMVLLQNGDMDVYLTAALLFAACLLVCDSRETETKPLATMTSRWVPMILISMVLLVALSTAGVQKWSVSVGEETQAHIHQARYETDYTTLPEGDFSKKVSAKGGSQGALVVTMEKPEQLYLRGFTAADFDGTTWEPLDGATVAKQKNLLYWLNCNGWNPQGFFATAAALGGAGEEEGFLQNITVQNLSACSKYLYVPYTLHAGETLVAENISPDGVAGDGNRTHLYTAVTGGTDRISDVLKQLQHTEVKETKAYRQAESAYRDFIYENYMAIPAEVKDQMEGYWKKAVKTYGGIDKMTTAEKQECIRGFMESCFPEKGEAPKLSLPLEQAKDTAYQKATVAVMTLRYFGIPSRYAEGYVITEDMAKNADNGTTIQVDGSCGGAWAELYQDGLGWIPMNLTPGIEEEALNMNLEDEDGELPKEISPQQQEEEPQTEEEMPEGGTVASIEEKLSLTFLAIIGVMLLAILLVVLRRKMILDRRMKRWSDGTPKDSIPWIFAESAALLERQGFKRGKGSMMELTAPVTGRFGGDYGKTFHEMVSLNARALFSSKALTEEERNQAKAFYAETLQQMTSDAKWYKKFWMQWILCLY